MSERTVPAFNVKYRLFVKFRSTNLRGNEVSREYAPNPSRFGRPKHSRLFKKSCQSFRFRIVQSPRCRQGLLPDQLQRESQAADCMVRNF